MRAFASTSAATAASLPLRGARCRRPAQILSAAARARSVHTLPPYNFPVENGLGNFLSPNALRTIAVEYQGGLLDRLNELVRGTDLEAMSVIQTVLSTARNPSQVVAFNMASQALNNSFFLDNLAPPEAPATNHEKKLASGLSNAIITEFGSLGQFKSNVSAAALGMMSSGWIWLVMDSSHRLGIIPTYGSGTVLVRSRQQMLPRHIAPSIDRQSDGLANDSSSILSNPRNPTGKMKGVQSASPPLRPTTSVLPSLPFSPNNQVRHFGVLPRLLSRSGGPAEKAGLFDERGNVYSSSGSLPTSSGPLHGFGDKLTPLFCLSVHEHAWMQDYGVWGKEEYLARFWDVLDWGRVGHLHYELTRQQ